MVGNAMSDENDELSLEQQIIAIKEEMLELGNGIKSLEDIFLYPPESRVSVYLSLDIGNLFLLHNVTLYVDDEKVSEYFYTAQEETGLNKGAVHLLHVENYLPGGYLVKALFEGIGPHGRKYRRAVSHRIIKGKSAKVLKIRIYDDVHTQQPIFMVENVNQCEKCQ